MFVERALAAFQLKRWKLVKAALDQELAQNPDNAYAFALLAASNLNSGHFAPAVEQAKKAIRLDPRMAYAYFILGLAQARCGQKFEAEIALEEALALEPQDADYLAVLASLKAVGSNESIQLLDQALASDPTHHEALHLKYGWLTRHNRKEEADSVRKRVLELYPEDPHMHEQTALRPSLLC